jgi:hypothetical protein
MRDKSKRPTRRKPGDGQDDLDADNLRSEISLLRELLHEVMARVEPDGPKDYMRLLDSVGRACGQLARLLRTQDQLGDQASLADEIGRIADEVRRELTGEGAE